MYEGNPGEVPVARAGDFCTVIIQVGVILFKFFLSLFPAPTNKIMLFKTEKGRDGGLNDVMYI